MRSKKVLRYYCDHCNKGFWKKSICLEHEEKCFKDPKNKACMTCNNKKVEEGYRWFRWLHNINSFDEQEFKRMYLGDWDAIIEETKEIPQDVFDRIDTLRQKAKYNEEKNVKSKIKEDTHTIVKDPWDDDFEYVTVIIKDNIPVKVKEPVESGSEDVVSLQRRFPESDIKQYRIKMG